MQDEYYDFYQLEAWRQAHELALDVYRITRSFPTEERFGLISQIRRATLSVSLNIAEGYGRYFFKDRIRFYYQARGSAAEVQDCILIARDLDYLSIELFRNTFAKTINVKKLINGLIRSNKMKVY